VIAGEEFSIFVTVQNPFEVPLTVRRVSTHIPVEFYDVDQRTRLRLLRTLEDQRADLEESARSLGLPAQPVLRQPPSGFAKFFSYVRGVQVLGVTLEFDRASNAGLAVARDLVPNTMTLEASASVPLIGKYKITRQLQAETDEESSENRERLARQIREERLRFERTMESLRQPDSTTLDLQPGNSTSRVFTLRSGEAIWFKPATYRFRIEIEYEIAGVRNIDTIEHVLQVKASLSSIILGSLLGSGAGFFARSGALTSFNWSMAIGLVTTLILAAMTVVLFARKKDVQPLIAVEDFWGGVAIGFLAAYAGQPLFARLLPTGS
jgi:hypothetical protein